MADPIAPRPSRVASVDLIRGMVMILMAIDHVRVFSGIPAGGPTPGVFFTRWVTHFCAPAFVFLAGTSAFLYARRHPDVSRFLWTRGLWLIFLELTFLRFAWTFNFEFGALMGGVIWMIGICMVLMAGLVKLPVRWIASIGILIIAGHNLLDATLWELSETLGNGPGDSLLKILYVSFWAGPISFGPDGPTFIILYSIVPWIGVMAAGYAFGHILTLEPARRNRLCLVIGLGATALFLLLRGVSLYGDPQPWSPDQGLLSFLATSKYPASLLFLLMTLGPTLALVPWLERMRQGPLARAVTLFGRVPFFFYMLHIPLIHLLAVGVSLVTTGEVNPWLLANHPMGSGPPPEGYVWSLGLLYVIWAIALAILYAACRWFVDLKARRSEWWLRYL